MDYTNLKKRLIDNYHSQGLSNCIGSVEKVVDELFDGLEEEPDILNDELTEIVDNLPPLFTEEDIEEAFK